jgi:hypothetical protein
VLIQELSTKRVKSRKLDLRAKVSILVRYEGEHIYRVYVPSRTRDKIVRSSNVRFNEGGLITELEHKDYDLDSAV